MTRTNRIKWIQSLLLFGSAIIGSCWRRPGAVDGNLVVVSTCPVGGQQGYIYDYDSFAAALKELRSLQPFILPKVRPVLYINTARTGSSIISSIIGRIADIRNMVVMTGGKTSTHGIANLGWPLDFPGSIAQERYANQMKQIDVIHHHAVLNKEVMQEYLRPHALTFMTLRDPYSHLVSTYNHFYSKESWQIFMVKLQAPEFSARAKGWKDTVVRSARCRNPMAHDLGWYAFNNGSEEYDHDADRIQTFLEKVEHEVGLFICYENMERGLVLLSVLLNVTINEMVSFPLQSKNNKYFEPNPFFTMTKIYDINAVDAAIYFKFCDESRFQKQWDDVNRRLAMQRNNHPSIAHMPWLMPLDERLDYLFKANKELNEQCGGKKIIEVHEHFESLGKDLLQMSYNATAIATAKAIAGGCHPSLYYTDVFFDGHFLYKQEINMCRAVAAVQ